MTGEPFTMPSALTGEQVEAMVEASLRCEKAAASIAESALNLMSLIERTQAEAAKMIAAQLKRSDRTLAELRSMRGEMPPPGTKIKLSDGRIMEVPPLLGRADAEGDAP
jgi:hypothetical protein